jgi:hypothetical protein
MTSGPHDWQGDNGIDEQEEDINVGLRGSAFENIFYIALVQLIVDESKMRLARN